MGPKSVSAVLEKLIRGLCLGDFPCGRDARSQREDRPGAAGDLLDLLRCPRSPWYQEPSWSPQAASLREMAARAPEGLRADSVYTRFTTLRITGKDVSVIDKGLLKFSKLEELVLSANKIGEVHAENLPGTLKARVAKHEEASVLELRSNRLRSMDGLVSRPLPHLRYLGLASNALEDASCFAGKHWPQLVCLDLGDCEFRDQRALLGALSSLPHLRTLVLEGNPFALASCYPGFAVDRLPKLLYLDSVWISPQERERFRGLAQMSGLTFDWTLATVKVGVLKGIPDPLKGAKSSTSGGHVRAYNYHITYDFFSHPAMILESSESKPQRRCDEPPTLNKSDLVHAEVGSVSACCTPKVTWSERMEFGDMQTYVICDLDGLKRFCHRGLDLSVVEEKSPVKPGSARDKSKNKKRSAGQPIQDAPRRVLGSVHVPLQSLLKRPQKVDVLCDFGLLREEPEAEAAQPENALKGRQDREGGRESSRGEKSSVTSKGPFPALSCENKLRICQNLSPTSSSAAEGPSGEDETEPSPSRQSEAATVELSVELMKWRSAAEARHHSA